jgi:hypothetical protein
MAFTPGSIPVIGVPGTAITGAAEQAVAQSLSSSFVPFVGSSLNQLAGSAAGAILNVGISQALGTKVAGQSGFDLSAGKNFLASQVTPYLTNTLSNAVSTSISDSLKNAGPLGPILGNLAGQAVSGLAQQVAQGLGLNIPGLAGGPGGGTGAGTQRFPGAGAEGEAPSNYAGKLYTPGTGGPDVKFSIRPANSGPQSFGLDQALSGAFATATSVPFFDFLKAAPNIATAAFGTTDINIDKLSSVIPAAAGLPSPKTLAAIAVPPGSTPTNSAGDTTDPSSGVSQPPAVWTFICAPFDINWSTNNVVNRVPIFGSNQPPVTTGSKGMRDLTMSQAIVEGFSRNVAIEQKVAILEDLMNYTLNTKGGYVNTPVYEITANDKKYGNGVGGSDGGKFVIKEVRVKEVLRDLSGNATRAIVDISFTQVPAYQVDGGRDQASAPTSKAQPRIQQTGGPNQGVGTTANPKSGENGPSTGAGTKSRQTPVEIQDPTKVYGQAIPGR